MTIMLAESITPFNWIKFFYSLFFTKSAIYGIFTHKKRTYSLGSFLKLEMVGVEPTSIVDKN